MKHCTFLLKDKSGVSIIVDKMKDCVVVNGVQYIFPSFCLFLCEIACFNV